MKDVSSGASSGLVVRAMERDDRERWDAFVESAADGTFFHLAGWQDVLERAFGHRTYFLLAEEDGAVCGVLPLARVKSWLFGDALSSLPFCVYGGPVARDATARNALVSRACEIADELGVDHLEFRSREPCRPDWPAKDLYVTFRRAISDSDDDNMKAIPRKQRAMVRKGIKAGLTSVRDDDVASLYQCYSESVRNLGTPVFSARYLEILAEVFGERVEITRVLNGDVAAAAVLSFRFRDEILPYYGGGGVHARGLAANDFLYWEVMRRAAAEGIKVFDYGRSKRDTGSYRFKKHWGFEPEPLHYEYYLVRSKAMPNLSPTNPKYRLFIAVWKRLPLFLSRMLGPRLARYLG